MTLAACANTLVSSRLDYCNFLLSGIKDQDLCHIQGIQNTLCRIITGASTYTSVTLHLRSLSWLSIKYGIVFKTCLISYKTLNHGLPPYFSQLLVPFVVNTRRSNPSNQYLLTNTFDYKINKSRHLFNACFSFTGPDLWNYLALQVRSAESIGLSTCTCFILPIPRYYSCFMDYDLFSAPKFFFYLLWICLNINNSAI